MTYNWGGYGASELERMRSTIEEIANQHGWDYVILEEHQARELCDFLSVMIRDIREYGDGLKTDDEMHSLYDSDYALERIEGTRCILRECGGSSD